MLPGLCVSERVKRCYLVFVSQSERVRRCYLVFMSQRGLGEGRRGGGGGIGPSFTSFCSFALLLV